MSLHWNIAADVLDVKVPLMLLQPLLENAFKHGVERGVGPVTIEVSAHRDGATLIVIVRNTGSKLASDYRDGVGLRNCRGRIHVICGAAANLQMLSGDDAVMAKVALPIAGHAT